MSLDKVPADLGAVVYGDCFIDGPSHLGICMPLTRPIQRVAAWMGAGQEEDTHHQSNLIGRLRASKKHWHTTMGPLMYDDSLLDVRLLTGVLDLASLNGHRELCVRA